MINHKDKWIFIHVPKCAGISVEIALNKNPYVQWDQHNKIWVQHATAEQVKRIYCKNYDEYFSFSFVRNPWNRAVSDYFWMMRTEFIKGSLKDYLLLRGSFDQPKFKYPPKNHHTRHDHFLTQCDFLLDKDGEPMVNFIGRFENLQKDFDVICSKIGIPPIKLPHENRTSHRHYAEYYDDETRQIVAEKYAKDIEYFGYEFGS